MKRLVAVLVVLLVSSVGSSVLWARGPDPLFLGQPRNSQPHALQGVYSTNPGQLQFLVVASPLSCNDGSDPVVCRNPLRIYFYDAACTRVDSFPLGLGRNQVAVLPLHDPSVTANRVGSFLIAAADPAAPAQALPTQRSIAAISYFLDLNTGVMRAEELSRLGRTGWLPYDAAGAVLLSPPDDGVQFVNTLQLRCPVGVTSGPIGTLNTLGGDMLDLASQEDGNPPGEAFLFPVSTRTLRDNGDDFFNGLFASAVTATIYDLDGNVLGTVASFPCSCLTEARLSAISGLAASQFTYWELFTTGGDPDTEIFTGAVNIAAPLAGPAVNFFNRIHHPTHESALTP